MFKFVVGTKKDGSNTAHSSTTWAVYIMSLKLKAVQIEKKLADQNMPKQLLKLNKITNIIT